MNCSKIISMNIGDACAPVVKGYRNRAVVINYDDIDFDALTRETANPHVVKTLTLKSGATAYKVLQRGAQPYTGTNSAMAQGTYQNDVTNTVQIVVPRDAETTNKFAQPLANGAEVVLILETKDKGADGLSAFEIWGLEGGLVATANTTDVSGDAGKNYIFTLTEVTTNLANFLDAGGYEATKTMVEGMVTQAAYSSDYGEDLDT